MRVFLRIVAGLLLISLAIIFGSIADSFQPRDLMQTPTAYAVVAATLEYQSSIVAPLNTPLPTLTPLPSRTPLPTLTPLPTRTPLPTNTPLPTLTPLPTNTPLPGVTPPDTATPLPTLTPLPTNTPFPTHTPTFTPSPTDLPSPTSLASPTNTSSPTIPPQPTALLGGALLQANVLQQTSLLSQPQYRPDLPALDIVDIPAGTHVLVFNKDLEYGSNWLRILWFGQDFQYVGWLLSNTTDLDTRKPNPIPVPPGCAYPVGTISSLNEQWVSSFRGKAVFVVDLFRLSSDNTLRSTLQLHQNGLLAKTREFEKHGVILLQGVIIETNVQQNDRVIFQVSNDDNLRFFAVVFDVGDGCRFGE
jgi:hypothetical protein